MHAVVRETKYNPDQPINEAPEFQEFQRIHANQPGYQGSVVVEVGAGRFVTVTLWRTADEMAAAREAIGPVVERLLDPLMAEPSHLLGTDRVVFRDLIRDLEPRRD